MADVFVVAIVLTVAKTSGFMASGRLEIGIYFFTASVLGTMYVAYLLKRALARRNRGLA